MKEGKSTENQRKAWRRGELRRVRKKLIQEQKEENQSKMEKMLPKNRRGRKSQQRSRRSSMTCLIQEPLKKFQLNQSVTESFTHRMAVM